MELVPASAKDLTALKDLDLKTYHYPLSDEAWKRALVDSPCVVYTLRISRTHIGYMVAEPKELKLSVHRLGIVPKYRGMGGGKRLLKRVDELAHDTSYTHLQAVIPDIHCIPNDPDNVSLWLKFQGFKATKVLSNYFYMYGDYRDGYLFERKVL